MNKSVFHILMPNILSHTFRLYTLLFVVFLSIESCAQHSDSVLSYFATYTLSEDSAKDANAKYLHRAIQLEREKQVVRDSLLAAMLVNQGSQYFSEAEMIKSIESFKLAIKHFNNVGLVKEATAAYKWYRNALYYLAQFDMLIPQEPTENDPYEQLFFTVDSIISQTADTVYVYIDGGYNQGVFVGSLGGVLTADIEGHEARGNIPLGKTEAVNVYNNHSDVKFVFYPGMNSHGLMVKDLVMFNLRTKNTEDNSDLKYLSSRDVHFNDLDGVPYYSVIDFNQKDDMNRSLLIAEGMLNEVNSVAEYLIGNEKYDTMFIASGKFKNLNWADALLATERMDIEAFLLYVRTYPFTYMGHDFPLANYYLAWMSSGCPMEEIVAFSEFLTIRINEMELDSSQELMAKFSFNDYMKIAYGDGNEFYTYLYNEYYIKQNKEAANLLEKMLWLSTNVPSLDSFRATMLYLKAYIKVDQEDLDGSIGIFTELVDSEMYLLNALWGRGYSLFEKKEYQKAIDDYDRIISLDSGYYRAMSYGNKGAALFRLADWKKAKILFAKAYSLDTTSAVWALNMGISHLTENKEDSAQFYLNKALDLTTSRAEYFTMLEAFDYLIDKGWFSELSTKYKGYLKDQWANNYQMIVQSNEQYTIAKQALDIDEYPSALMHLDSAIQAESSKKEVNYMDLRYYLRWKAYAHYVLKQYDSSLNSYKKALFVNENHIHSNFLKVDDYDDIGNIYSWLNDDVNTNLYADLEYGLSYKLKMDTLVPRLYYLGISTSMGHSPYLYSENDVTDLHSAIADKSNKAFQSIEFKHLKNPSSKELQELFVRWSAEIDEDDVLILHIASPSYQTINERGFMLNSTDSLSLKKLFSNLSYIRTKNILAIADAPRTKFVEDYISYKNRINQEFENNNVYLISPATARFENKESKHSVLVDCIINSIKEGSELNTKTLDNLLANNYSQAGPYLALSSYNTGRAIKIYSSDVKAETVTSGLSEKGVSRGVVVHDPELENAERGRDYALLFATNEYDSDKWGDLNNPINDALALKKILEEDYGFSVEIVLNATQREVTRKLTEYKNRKFNARDQLLIYFAGHGYYDEKEGDAYLVCKNSVYTDDEKRDGYPTYIHYSFLNASIGHLKSCKNVFMIMDVCFGGTFFDKTQLSATYASVRQTEIPNLIQNKRDIQTRVFLTSGGKEYVPDGAAGANSPFSTQLLTALTDRKSSNGQAKSYLTMEDLVSYMHGLPTKVKYGTFGIHQQNGDFIFEYKKSFEVVDISQGSSTP